MATEWMAGHDPFLCGKIGLLSMGVSSELVVVSSELGWVSSETGVVAANWHGLAAGYSRVQQGTAGYSRIQQGTAGSKYLECNPGSELNIFF
jgi:uncharacterized Ntn-hydrolase superfamily protein